MIVERGPDREHRGCNRVLLVGSLVVVALGILTVLPFIAFVWLTDDSWSCGDWGSTDKATIEAVSLAPFVGREIAPQAATCDSSLPKTLFIEVSNPLGTTMPERWFEPDTLGVWTAQYKLEQTPNGAMVCYVPPEAEADAVELRVWANGSAVAAINKGRVPCQRGQG